MYAALETHSETADNDDEDKYEIGEQRPYDSRQAHNAGPDQRAKESRGITELYTFKSARANPESSNAGIQVELIMKSEAAALLHDIFVTGDQFKIQLLI